MQHLNKTPFKHRSKFTQLILLNEQAMIVSSCDSIFETSHRLHQNVCEWFPFIESVFPSIWPVLSQQANISFNKVETTLEELPGIYDFSFSQIIVDSKTLLLWCIYDYTDLYEDFRQFQQRKNELEIHRETLERRHKMIRHLDDISIQPNIIMENLNHLQLTYFNKIKSALTAPVNALDGLTFLLTQVLEHKDNTYTQQLRFALKRLNHILNELEYPNQEQASILLKDTFSLDDLCKKVGSFLREKNDTLNVKFSIEAGLPPIIHGNFLYLQQTLTGILGNATALHPSSSFNVYISLLEKTSEDIRLNFQIEEQLSHTANLLSKEDYSNMVYRLSVIKQLLDLQKSNILVDKNPKDLSISICFDLYFKLIDSKDRLQS